MNKWNQTKVQSELQALINQHGKWCASLYLPTHRNSLEVRQDSLRLKNLLREAEKQLQSLGMADDSLRKMLRPARELLAQESFWQHQQEGLGIFFTEDFFQFICLPIPVPELCVVTERFHLKSLLRWLTSEGEFHVLTLSQNQTRLYVGTRFTLTDITPAAMPQGITNVLGEEDTESHLQFRASGQGGGATIAHGHNTAADGTKERLVRYFQEINKALAEMLQGDRKPLVLAGVDYLHPIYREVSPWPQLLPTGVMGNPERFSTAELQNRAWELVHPFYQQQRQQAIAQYKEMRGTGRTTDRVSEVVTAAAHGRVETLFVPVGVHRWGQFDAEANTVTTQTEPQPGAEDLLDLAALETLSKGGRVFVVQPEQMPEEVAVAAVLRY